MAADQLSQTVVQGGASSPLKLLALLGGAAIGALLAIAAVFYGLKPAIDRADSAELAAQLRQLRRRTMAWMAVFGLCWVAAYELTQSAWGPISCMTMLTVVAAEHAGPAQPPAGATTSAGTGRRSNQSRGNTTPAMAWLCDRDRYWHRLWLGRHDYRVDRFGTAITDPAGIPPA